MARSGAQTPACIYNSRKHHREPLRTRIPLASPKPDEDQLIHDEIYVKVRAYRTGGTLIENPLSDNESENDQARVCYSMDLVRSRLQKLLPDWLYRS